MFHSFYGVVIFFRLLTSLQVSEAIFLGQVEEADEERTTPKVVDKPQSYE